MPLSEDKAVEVLTALINRPGTILADMPRVWGELLTIYAQHYDAAVVAQEPKKRKRRKLKALSPNLGWPSGVSRAEYRAWKEKQQAAGTPKAEINPQTYKRQRDEAERGMLISIPV